MSDLSFLRISCIFAAAAFAFRASDSEVNISAPEEEEVEEEVEEEKEEEKEEEEEEEEEGKKQESGSVINSSGPARRVRGLKAASAEEKLPCCRRAIFRRYRLRIVLPRLESEFCGMFVTPVRGCARMRHRLFRRHCRAHLIRVNDYCERRPSLPCVRSWRDDRTDQSRSMTHPSTRWQRMPSLHYDLPSFEVLPLNSLRREP